MLCVFCKGGIRGVLSQSCFYPCMTQIPVKKKAKAGQGIEKGVDIEYSMILISAEGGSTVYVPGETEGIIIGTIYRN